MAVSPYGQALKAPATLAETVVYTADGTFTKADYPGIKYVRVRAVGGGGGGGGAGATATGQVSCGGGGGGAGYAESVIYVDELADSETVTIGAGGAGGGGNNPGATGGASSFGAHVSANGGEGGAGSAGRVIQHGNGGKPGAGAVGDILIAGQGGQSVIGHSDGAGGRSIGGAGGGTPLGGGAEGRGANAGSIIGRGYGGGGSGVALNESKSAASGGDGFSGVVIVDVYVQEQGLVGDTGFVHPNQFPKGLIGFDEQTSDITGIGTAAVELLSVTLDVPASRRIRVAFIGGFVAESNTAGFTAFVEIQQNGSRIRQTGSTIYSGGADRPTPRDCSRVLTPTGAQHTFRVLAYVRSGETGSFYLQTAYGPGQLLIEDLGPA